MGTERMKYVLAIHSQPVYFDIFVISRKTSVASRRPKATEPMRVNLVQEEIIITVQIRVTDYTSELNIQEKFFIVPFT